MVEPWTYDLPAWFDAGRSGLKLPVYDHHLGQFYGWSQDNEKPAGKRAFLHRSAGCFPHSLPAEKVPMEVEQFSHVYLLPAPLGGGVFLLANSIVKSTQKHTPARLKYFGGSPLRELAATTIPLESMRVVPFGPDRSHLLVVGVTARAAEAPRERQCHVILFNASLECVWQRHVIFKGAGLETGNYFSVHNGPTPEMILLGVFGSQSRVENKWQLLAVTLPPALLTTAREDLVGPAGGAASGASGAAAAAAAGIHAPLTVETTRWMEDLNVAKIRPCGVNTWSYVLQVERTHGMPSFLVRFDASRGQSASQIPTASAGSGQTSQNGVWLSWARLPMLPAVRLVFEWQPPGMLLVAVPSDREDTTPPRAVALVTGHVPWTPTFHATLAPAYLRPAARALVFLRVHAASVQASATSTTTEHESASDVKLNNDQSFTSLACLWGTLPIELLEHVIACLWDSHQAEHRARAPAATPAPPVAAKASS